MNETTTATRCAHCWLTNVPLSPDARDPERLICARCHPAVRDDAVIYRHAHPERGHHWFRYCFEPESARRCDSAGCHARAEDVVQTAQGFDSGYVTFATGERSF